MAKIKIVLFCICLSLTNTTFAQKSNYVLQQANKTYDNMQFSIALKLYEKYYPSDTSNNTVILRVADCYWRARDYEKSFLWYKRALNDTISKDPALNRRFAELNAIKGNYDYAAEKLNAIPQFQERAEGFKFKNEFLKDSGDWRIGYLNINTPKFKEFSPFLFNGKFIWSTNQVFEKERKSLKNWNPNGKLKQVYLSEISFLETVEFPSSINSDTQKVNPVYKYIRHFSGADVPLRFSYRSIVPPTKNDTSKYLFPELKFSNRLFQNVAHASGSEETGKIYLSASRRGRWPFSHTSVSGVVEGELDNDFIINANLLTFDTTMEKVTDKAFLHGAVDPSGQYLVYSSNREGNKGGYDLYVVKKNEDGSGWSNPIALDDINSAGNEVFSTFSPDGDLYFSSDGLKGLGGLDIYRVGFNKGTTTSAPEHLAYPINSSHDEFGMVFASKNKNGFFTTDRFGSDDIIAFNYKKKYAPLTGLVVEQGTNEKRPNISVYLYIKDYKGVQTQIDSAITNKDGVYNFPYTRPNREYTVYIHEPRVENTAPKMVALSVTTPPSTNLIELPTAAITRSKSSEPILVNNNLKLQSKDSGLFVFTDTSWLKKHDPHEHQRIMLDSVYFTIYFDFDKYTLTPTTTTTLNNAVNYLKENPKNGFVLLGHTDLRGNPVYNLNLSKNRVTAAKKYITSRGIDKTRIELEYFGTKFPVKRSLTKEAGKLNRRVEFLLFKK
jgi:outer membrane protein OmpA-like peptidoglycan-associated protein